MRRAARTIVICPFATPNGPLHIGHLAGPYLAADVHARHVRATGRPVVLIAPFLSKLMVASLNADG